MSDSLIQAALRTRLKAIAGIPTVTPQNGAPFTPVPGQTYIDDTLAYGTRTLRTFPAIGGEVDQAGFYQLDIYAPLGGGTAPTDALVNAIDAAFRPGQDLATSDPSRPVFVVSFARFPGSREGDRYRTTLRITWRRAGANALTSV